MAAANKFPDHVGMLKRGDSIQVALAFLFITHQQK